MAARTFRRRQLFEIISGLVPAKNTPAVQRQILFYDLELFYKRLAPDFFGINRSCQNNARSLSAKYEKNIPDCNHRHLTVLFPLIRATVIFPPAVTPPAANKNLV